MCPIKIFLLVLLVILIFYLFHKLLKDNKKLHIPQNNNYLDSWFTKKLKAKKLKSINNKIQKNIISKNETELSFRNEVAQARDFHEQNDGMNAIQNYLNIYEKYNYSYVLLDIADIYNYGSANTKPNSELAMYYYNRFLKNANENTPIYYINEVYQKMDLIEDNTNDVLKLYLHNLDKDYDYFTPNPINTELNNVLYEPILNDPQNVHDTTVNNCVKKIVDELKQDNYPKYSLPQIIENLPGVDNRVLEYISFNTEKRFDLRLIDLLELVFSRFKGKNFDISVLEHSLNSCIENGSVVCYVGVFNRMVDSLNGIDNNVVIKSRDLIGRELMDVCAKIALDNVDCSSEEQKSLMLEKLDSDYVKSGVMTDEELKSYISTWIDHI